MGPLGFRQSKMVVIFFVTLATWLLVSLIQTTAVLSQDESRCNDSRQRQSFERPNPSVIANSNIQGQKNSPLRYPPGRQYSEPRIEPTLGKHRPQADAIFSMATGYDIDDHLITVGSLLAANYSGDIVLGVQPIKDCSDQLQAFLQYHAEHSNLVVYAIPPCEMLVPDLFKHPRCNMKYAYRNPYNENKPVSRTTNRMTGNDLAARHQSPRKFRVSLFSWFVSMIMHQSSKPYDGEFHCSMSIIGYGKEITNRNLEFS